MSLKSGGSVVIFQGDLHQNLAGSGIIYTGRSHRPFREADF